MQVTEKPERTKNYPTCGALTHRDESNATCLRPAGWGTPHPGFGRCKLHGGTRQNTARMEIEARMATQTMGTPKRISAVAALEDELWRTAGHVEWLGMIVASLEAVVASAEPVDANDPKTLILKNEGLFDWQRSPNGMLWRQPSVWVNLYQSERKHLLNVSALLVKLGVDKERLDVIRSSGLKMASIFQAVLGDDRLGLTEQQLKIIPDLIREHVAAKQIESTP